MTSYLATLWRKLAGPSHTLFDETDYLDALRPRSTLHIPRRLPTTPTRSHLPPLRREIKDTGKKSKQCPHCRKTFYVQLPKGRISKPKKPRGTKKGGKAKTERWISVDGVYKVEDLSPTLSTSKGYQGAGRPGDDAMQRRYQAGVKNWRAAGKTRAGRRATKGQMSGV